MTNVEAHPSLYGLSWPEGKHLNAILRIHNAASPEDRLSRQALTKLCANPYIPRVASALGGPQVAAYGFWRKTAQAGVVIDRIGFLPGHAAAAGLIVAKAAVYASRRAARSYVDVAKVRLYVSEWSTELLVHLRDHLQIKASGLVTLDDREGQFIKFVLGVAADLPKHR